MKTKNRIILTIAFALVVSILLYFTMVSAEVQTLGTYKVNTCISLLQSCSNCTYSNITSIVYPDSTQALAEVVMTKIGTNYNYTFCGSNQLGNYIVNGRSDVDGLDTIWAYDYNVTPSGSGDILGFFILIVIMIYGIAFVGFFGKSEWVTILGGMAMIGLGLFTINNGIDVYRNQITEIFSWTTIALGAFFALYAGTSVIKENF